MNSLIPNIGIRRIDLFSPFQQKDGWRRDRQRQDEPEESLLAKTVKP
jgi:hypothetical protein